MGNTGYSNELKILKKQIAVLEAQVVSLTSIDSKLTGVSSEDAQLAQTDALIIQKEFQEDLLLISSEILEQIKALRGGEFPIIT